LHSEPSLLAVLRAVSAKTSDTLTSATARWSKFRPVSLLERLCDVRFGSKADIARCNLDARFAGKQLRVHGVFLARRCLAQRLFPRVRNFRLIAAINHPCERNRTQDRGKRDHLRTDDQLLGTTRAASNRESWALGSWSCCGFAP
jgi:hypothetical protein